jgi:hypothetical protein
MKDSIKFILRIFATALITNSMGFDFWHSLMLVLGLWFWLAALDISLSDKVKP